MGSREQGVLFFHYKFTFADGSVKEFHVELDGKTLTLLARKRESYPEWARLSFKQCPNCPLKEKESPCCPIAANLVDLVESFKDSFSFDKADIEISTNQRTYLKQATLMEGIRSLIGIYMVTSGCPILDRLKPMVRTHLPFATWEETLYRAVSTYLLAQYFIQKHGGDPDWNMEKLAEIYEDIRIVNKSFCQRLWQTTIEDATLNAVVQLDSFANFTSNLIKNEKLGDMEKLFHAYLSDRKT